MLNRSVASATSLKNWSSSSGGRKSSASPADLALAMDGAPTTSRHLVRCITTRSSPEPASSQGVEMESGIWSRLSPELVHKVLGHVPASSLLRFRSVCKEWKATISSPSFLNSLPLPNAAAAPSSSGAAASLPWLFLCPAFNCRDACCAYNPACNKWYTIPLTFLPPPARFPLAAAPAAGLLLLRGGGGGGGHRAGARPSVLTVCNPITGGWRQLPSMTLTRSNPLVGVVQDCTNTNRRSFKIVVAGGTCTTGPEAAAGTEYQCSTEVYDSATDSWTVTGPPLPREYAVRMTAWTSKTVSCGGSTLYCLTSGRPCSSIMAYNLDLGRWSELAVPAQPDHLFSSSVLLERQGRLLLVGGVGTARSCHRVVVLELRAEDGQQQQWVEVARMPERFFKKLVVRGKSSSAAADLKCAGNGNLVYFFKDSHTPVRRLTMVLKTYKCFCCGPLSRSFFNCDTSLSLIRDGRLLALQVMVCDLSRTPACWRWLPCCPLSFYFQRFAVKGLFVEPRLNASLVMT